MYITEIVYNYNPIVTNKKTTEWAFHDEFKSDYLN